VRFSTSIGDNKRPFGAVFFECWREGENRARKITREAGMATDFTQRLDEETKRAQAFGPQVPTLGSGLSGMSRVVFDAGVNPPAAGRDASGIITADSTKVAVDGGAVSGGVVAPMSEGNAAMARENKIRGEMLAMDPTGFATPSAPMAPGQILPGEVAPGVTRQDAENAEKTARWRMDDLIDKASRGNQVAIAAAMNSLGALERQREQNIGDIQKANIAADAQRAGQSMSYAAQMAGQGVTMRGQDLAAQEAALRTGIMKTDSERAADKWGIEKKTMQGAQADSEAVRTARANLSAALASGDPVKIASAREQAVAAGIKFDKPNNEFTSVTDSMGLNVTRTNKDTGQVDIINPKTGEVRSIAPPGAAPQQKPIPPGHTVIGTSGGKRVLQDANGKRFIEN
jgi:hypothetical protein